MWCSLHDNASNTGPQISQASGFLHVLFPKCPNSETANISFLIYKRWEKKGDLIKDVEDSIPTRLAPQNMKEKLHPAEFWQQFHRGMS